MKRLVITVIMLLMVAASVASADQNGIEYCQNHPGFCQDPEWQAPPLTPVPEPTTWILMGTGVAGLIGLRLYTRKKGQK